MTFKIFISSPGDVRAERDVAERVINQLGKDMEILPRWRLQAVRWDKDSEGVVLEARLSPQAAVSRKLPKPSECDLVLVILGSRMGTPLDATYKKKDDGSAYLSGTEWEYCDAAQARGPDGKPAIWVYHREQDATPEGEDAVEQKKNLKLFLDSIRDSGEASIPTNRSMISLSSSKLDYANNCLASIESSMRRPSQTTPRLSDAAKRSHIWSKN